MAKKTKKLCPYWVWSKESNVHVVESMEWFTDYTPFRTKVHKPTGKAIAAVGIGTVYLSLRRVLGDDRPSAFDVFKMENVLHVPSAAGNVVGGPLEGLKIKYDITPAGHKSTAIANKTTGNAFFYFHTGWEDLGLLRVAVDIKMQCGSQRGCEWLRRISEELTPFTWSKEDKAEWVNRKKSISTVHHEIPVASPTFVMSTVYPPMDSSTKPAKGKENKGNKEKQVNQAKQASPAKQSKQAKQTQEAKVKSALDKWAVHSSTKPPTPQSARNENNNGHDGKAPLNDTEEAWMASNFGTEYKFLCENGLFINSEIDRQKGRHILRAMIASEKSESVHGASHSEVGEAMGTLGEQLNFFEEAWLQKHFGSESQFFKHYNMSIGDRAQRRQGLHMIRAMMTTGSPKSLPVKVKGEAGITGKGSNTIPQTVLASAINRLAVSGDQRPQNNDDANKYDDHSEYDCGSVKRYQEPAETTNQPTQNLPLVEYLSDEESSRAISPDKQSEICLMDLWSEDGAVNEMAVSLPFPSESYHQPAFSLLD